MTPEQNNRLETLLYDLGNIWDNPGSRHSLLRSVFQGHEIWLYLDSTGSQKEAARNLLEQLALHDLRLIQGERPVCALLMKLRDGVAHERPTLRAAVDALLDELRITKGSTQRRRWSGPPFLGLTFFDRRHAPVFFGREDELQDLVEASSKGQGSRFLIVIGASGSGKSSLVRAGLWAGLKAGQFEQYPDSDSWLFSAMTPTDMDDPMDSLRAALNAAIDSHDDYQRPEPVVWNQAMQRAEESQGGLVDVIKAVFSHHPEGQWLLILDQMEELFTSFDADERERFIDQLIAATRPRANGRKANLQVIATLRADFYQHCVAHPSLLCILRLGGEFLLGPPQQRSLERMITGPLMDVDLLETSADTHPFTWTLDPGVATTIATEAYGQHGGLALMAFTLRELYERCKDKRHLSLEDYLADDFGGLSGVIARRADAVLHSLDVDADSTLQRIFTALVHVGEDKNATRRRAPLLTWTGDQKAQAFIAAFVKARLLITDRSDEQEPLLEVAHEALLREWPVLAQWIHRQADALQLCDQIRKETRGWVANGSQHQRAWPPGRIDQARLLIDSAGMLQVLEKDNDIANFLRPERQWLLEELHDPRCNHERRAFIGRRLSELGDDRYGVGTDAEGVPQIDWVSISAGEFVYQAGERRGIESFAISRYSVTHAQFQAFVEAEDGYCDDRWWQDLTVEPNDRKMNSSHWSLANHPRERVSWFEAQAFCAWLGYRLNQAIELPTEWQWERVALGTDGWGYPWGPFWRADACNTVESGLNRTTAVGLYPQGASVEGVLDLTGNVWEWCRNEYKEPAHTQARGREARVMRGGSWFNVRDYSRADDRYESHPDYRNYGLGFRLVCESPIHLRPLVCP